MRPISRLASALTPMFVILASAVAPAAVHTWHVDEIYSNASGTVQFIEMITPFDFENQFASAGAKLNSRNNANTILSTFNFPSNTPTNTANHTVLIGTSNLTALAGVTPDFVLPAGFLLPGGGKLEFFATSFGSLDTDTYPALTGGTQSYNPDTFGTALNTPKNFANVEGRIVPEPSSLAIAMAGLFALGWIGRQYRRSRAF